MITIDALKGIIGSRDPAELMETAKGLDIDVSSFLGSDFDINNLDINDLSSLLGEGKSLDDLLTTFLSGPGNKHDNGDDTFSFILPAETVKLLDGLLLQILSPEKLIEIDQAINIERLFEIELPTALVDVINDAIMNSNEINIDELLADGLLPAVLTQDNGNEPNNDDDTFSIILPAETVKLLDGLLLQILPPEKLLEIDQAIHIERLFDIELPIDTFSAVNDAIIHNDAFNVDELLSTIFTHDDGRENDTFSFILPAETVKLLDGLLLQILPPEKLIEIDQALNIERLFEIELPTALVDVINDAIMNSNEVNIDELLANGLLPIILPQDNGLEPNNDDDTFSIILPVETVKLLDEILLEVLPLATLLEIDQAIHIERLFDIELPIDTFSAVNDAVAHNGDADIHDILSTILPENDNAAHQGIPLIA
jgi:hypothetical protein